MAPRTLALTAAGAKRAPRSAKCYASVIVPITAAPKTLGVVALVWGLAGSVSNDAIAAEHEAILPEKASEPTPSTKEPRPRTHWYGWQILLTDATAGALFAGSHALRAPVPAWTLFSLSIGTYALGGPIIHLAHGQTARAVGSLGLRVALPAALGLLVHPFGGCDGVSKCERKRASIAVVAGLVSALVIDATFLAWEPRERPAPRAFVLPSLDLGTDGGQVGLTGSF